MLSGQGHHNRHFEIAGVLMPEPLPTYPNGFPVEIIEEFSRLTGRAVLCNRPASGTAVIEEYGPEHLRTGALIVYTSADSVFQIAAHEDVVPVEQLYADCRIARKLLSGKHGVGRVIARPFIGQPGSFTRTARRHDFSIEPPAETLLDRLHGAGLETIAVGKINDIFAGRGVSPGRFPRPATMTAWPKRFRWSERIFGDCALLIWLISTRVMVTAMTCRAMERR